MSIHLWLKERIKNKTYDYHIPETTVYVHVISYSLRINFLHVRNHFPSFNIYHVSTMWCYRNQVLRKEILEQNFLKQSLSATMFCVSASTAYILCIQWQSCIRISADDAFIVPCNLEVVRLLNSLSTIFIIFGSNYADTSLKLILHACLYTCTWIYMHVCTCVCIHVHIHMCVCTKLQGSDTI